MLIPAWLHNYSSSVANWCEQWISLQALHVIVHFCAHLYRKIVFIIMDFFHITHLFKKLRSFIEQMKHCTIYIKLIDKKSKLFWTGSESKFFAFFLNLPYKMAASGRRINDIHCVKSHDWGLPEHFLSALYRLPKTYLDHMCCMEQG